MADLRMDQVPTPGVKALGLLSGWLWPLRMKYLINSSISSKAKAKQMQINHWLLEIWVIPNKLNRTGKMINNSEIP